MIGGFLFLIPVRLLNVLIVGYVQEFAKSFRTRMKKKNLGAAVVLWVKLLPVMLSFPTFFPFDENNLINSDIDAQL